MTRFGIMAYSIFIWNFFLFAAVKIYLEIPSIFRIQVANHDHIIVALKILREMLCGFINFFLSVTIQHCWCLRIFSSFSGAKWKVLVIMLHDWRMWYSEKKENKSACFGRCSFFKQIAIWGFVYLLD